MASNPNPTRTSDALWWFWTEFKKIEPSAQYGGTYAEKPGYHSYRDRLKKTDYSVEDVANDRKGSGTKCSAIDLSMSDAAMRKYSKRLDAAMRARDKRLFIDGKPILREFIGTKDSKSVYCYVLVGGKQLGVGADSGPDSGRDKSHLWHIHLSFIRLFNESRDAMERVLSILKGESEDAWLRRHGVVTDKPKPQPTPAKPPVKPTGGLPSHARGSREVKEGMRGTDVQWVQKWISSKHIGPADGIAGPRFTAGVKWYQNMRGLRADGIVGPKTWAAMGVKYNG
jgi:peptidoglycan hydrolase-like protein with peptidoglycan-binding domain